MLRVIRKTTREVSISAQLCPPRLRGVRICWVNRLMNQLWRTSRRLCSHRRVGAGKKIQGKVRAIASSGTPR